VGAAADPPQRPLHQVYASVRVRQHAAMAAMQPRRMGVT
jgi:hypothetical protein